MDTPLKSAVTYLRRLTGTYWVDLPLFLPDLWLSQSKNLRKSAALDKSPMGIAGIWEHWNAPDGTALETFSVLTTEANKLVSKLHDRMPVILHPDNYGLWLSKNMHDSHALESLYSPYPDKLMAYYEVPKLVNNPRFDFPSCIVQV